MKTLGFLFLPLLLLSLAPAAWAQNVFIQGNALSNRTFNSDNGPTNSQLTLDFTNAQPGVLQNILTWGGTSGSSLSGIGQSFELFVLRPTGGNNYQVVFATGYMTVTSVGTNTFAISGAPFGLQVGDVIAHYGRGIPFNNGTGGPSSVYIAVNLPPPVLNATITVPSATYPLYNDGGRNYAIQVQLLGQPFLVTTNNDNGPGSLRQAVLDANAFAGASTINFATNLSGQIITLTSGQIVLSKSVTIDASALTNGIAINGNGTSRVFEVTNATVVLNSLTITNGYVPDGTLPVNSGGGILNFGNLSLNACAVQNNQAIVGGGIDNYAGTLTVNKCTFAHNSSFLQGGGIDNYFLGTLAANNCTFASNTSYYGGAIDNDSATATLTQCTIVSNQSDDVSASIDNFSSTLNLRNCLIAGSTDTSGAGRDLFMESGSLTATNCLIGDGTSSAITNGVKGNLAGTSSSPINALLAGLGNYGGPTPTMPPLPGSPAIDAGAVTTLTTDQRGFPRVVGPKVDIGAVESGNAIPGFIPVVTTNSDTIYSIGAGAVSLREAVAFATNNSIVTFAPALSGQTITLTSGELWLDKNLLIDGSALANGIRISGNHNSRIFYISNNAAPVLNSLTLLNGNGSGGDGGALYNAGNPIINNCTFTGNSAGSGGALKNASGSLILNECTFTGNSTAGGGGGAIVNYAPLLLNTCTLTTNSAGIFGGAIYNETGGTVNMNNSIAAGNSSVDFDNNGALTLVGSNIVQIIFGNSSTGTTPINANPLLAPLGNYGGPTPTMPPLPGSPAIDASAATTFTTDQRGYPRSVGLGPDIGAVEGIYNTDGPGQIKTIARLGNGSVQLSFTNVTDAVFPVLASTNLSQSLSNWTQIGFAAESPVGSGQFPFIDTQATNYPQRFYRIRSP